MVTVEEVTAALGTTRVSATGISFAGKSLKLNTESDAKPVVDAINSCAELQFLNLEGNTLGVDASKVIAEALEKHPEFKRALWKDMFTGRMKTEIPKALEFLGNGLVTAGARLTELDLSDNAFGPIGVQGLAALLKSSSCYALEELKLNNNGLGIGGGKLLAGALLDCYNCSKQQGKPLALKVFIAGRNRLENEGAKALAKVFKTIGTLEEITMPQNGIYHVGITALSEAFKHNKNLQILNLNDNTIGPKGAQALASVLPQLQNLRVINFGDCLLKTKGAKLLASGLKTNSKLKEVILDNNEIRLDGAAELIQVMGNKSNLKNLVLDGNQFGEAGKKAVKNKMKEIGKLNALGSLSDNESEDSEDESDKDSDPEDEAEEEVDILEQSGEVEAVPETGTVTVQEFISSPTTDKFLALGEDRTNIIFTEAKKYLEANLEDFLPLLMKISALSACSEKQVTEGAIACCEVLYREMFTWAMKAEKVSMVNNSLLVNLGLIKCEDKKYRPSWNTEGCILVLDTIVKKYYFPESTKDVLRAFLIKNTDSKLTMSAIKQKLMATLTQKYIS